MSGKIKNSRLKPKNLSQDTKDKLQLIGGLVAVVFITGFLIFVIGNGDGGSDNPIEIIDELIEFAEENIEDKKTKESIVNKFNDLKKVLSDPDPDPDEVNEKVEKAENEIIKENDEEMIDDADMRFMLKKLQKIKDKFS